MMIKYFSILTLFLVACSQNSNTLSESERWESHAVNVEIIRDDFGIPHIYGKTDADAVFGLLYAQCEDDFRRVERNFTWAIGRLAETEGEEMLYSDLRARLFMTEAEAKNHFESAPKWLKKLGVAWADGINYYLHTHPEVKPKSIKNYEPWMTMYFTEGSIGGDLERVSTQKIKAFYEKKQEIATVENSTNTKENLFLDEPRGSNGFAISGKLTASGNSMLLINPHTSFYFRGEVHVVSEEGLNAYGAVTWGQFFVYQGFNENTGWMHTSTYTDVIDEFKETINEKENKLYYQYGKEQRLVEMNETTIKYRVGEEMKEKIFPIYRTHHGPITHIVDNQWTATALMWDPVKALEQSYTRTKKKNLNEFHQMMDIRTNSSNNTVFADSEGNIAYYHGNFIPIRDEQFDYTKPVDGSNIATDWQGLHSVEEAITVINPPNGWIQNCNSTPFTSAAAYSPKKNEYPNYMSRASENYRAVHAIQLLSKIEKLSLEELIALAYDPYLPAFEYVIPGLIDAYDNSLQDETIREAIHILRTWDYTTGVDSKAMSLAHFYGLMLYKHGVAPEKFTGMEKFNYFGTDLPPGDRLRIFKLAIQEMKKRYTKWIIPWGEINRFQRINGNLNLHFNDSLPSIPVAMTTGRWGALAAYGMRGTHDEVNKIYGTRGNSFVAAVEFGDTLKAKTILAGGQSSDPNSLHFYDQAGMYANQKFKEVPFYRKDVMERAEEIYSPGKR